MEASGKWTGRARIAKLLKRALQELPDHDEKPPKDHLSPGDTSRRILVCSNVLTLASPVFRAQLNGKWKDSKEHAERDANGKMMLTYPGDDPTAMVLLCRILHNGLACHLPWPWPAIYKVAVLTDKYDCYSATKLWFSNQWRQQLPMGDLLRSVPRDADEPATHVLKLTYFLKDCAWFAFASKLFAYCGCVYTLTRDLRKSCDEIIHLPHSMSGDYGNPFSFGAELMQRPMHSSYVRIPNGRDERVASNAIRGSGVNHV